MPRLNQLNAQDSYLGGNAVFTQWIKDFTVQWYGPSIENLIGLRYGMLDPATKAELEQMSPGITEALDRRFGVKE